MELQHCANDLGEMIARLEERKAANIAAVRAMGRELTPVESARFEVGLGLLRDLLCDLHKMQESWQAGHGLFRTTEQMLGHEE